MTLTGGDDITQVFRESWNMYQKVVSLNHLNHREIVNAFAQQLQTYGKDAIVDTDKEINGLRVLDIGVGDGWLPSQLLTSKNIPKIAQFTGVDTTAEALAIAKTTAALIIPAEKQEWHQADMSEYMQQCKDNTYDVIYSNYAIHHLDSSQENGKPALLREIYRCLSPNSLFLWGDVYNNLPGRSHEEMMELWNEKKFSKYEGLTEEERANIWDHVSTFDLPEELEEMKKMMSDAGFMDVTVCYDDGFYSTVLSGRKK